ncbi:NADH:flavin oxidoreductase / NADH oxidase [Devosia geojensis]|uniref:NADH:flavin oxidoreductase / NADH oxidase n=1 Tax=Devosia geojensis TaxID=443610 RepID=A0A0F5FRG0_9HYPH|nr:NADH:flavin oxidoreductase/NADH oxidase [Devosia geojensis]KKB11474.1 NADH:flavin oxidoreductase / NADH oxidase [Devosia geojensis]
MPKLMSPITLRGLTLRNRTVVAPMCQYSAVDGFANDWHMVHLGRFGIGGFGLVIVEATGVLPEARISYGDLGLWKDEHIAPLARIVDFLHGQGAAAGIQLAHAGRKASTPVSWRGPDQLATEEQRRQAGYEHWVPVAPSAQSHDPDNYNFQTPAALDKEGIGRVIDGFVAAARRAEEAGFDTVEIHAAHGYLLNQFLSPLANHRTDEYGGSRENRMRLVLEIAEAVRAVWPADKPLLARLSVSDNAEGGWSVEDSVVLAGELKARGVDAIDCSSGGFAQGRIISRPGYQVPFAQAVKTGADIPTMAVGVLGDVASAEAILANGEADFIALARGALDDPNWAVHAGRELGGDYSLWPVQTRRVAEYDRVMAQARSIAAQ